MKFNRFMALSLLIAAVACEGVKPDDDPGQTDNEIVEPVEKEYDVDASSFLKSTDSEGLTMSVSETCFQIGVDSAYFVLRYNGEIIESGYKIYEKGASKETVFPTVRAKAADGKIYTIPYWSPSSTECKSFWMTYKTSSTKAAPVTITALEKPVPDRVPDPKPESVSFKRRAFIFDFTGTNCGYCPYMIAAIDEVVDAKDAVHADDAVVAEVHAYNSSVLNPIEGLGIATYFGVSGFPDVRVNFNSKIGSLTSHDANVYNLSSAIESAISSPATAGISASYTTDNNVLQARVTVKAAETGNYRLGMFILEDGLEEAQANNSLMPDAQFLIHNDVTRYVDAELIPNNFSGHNLGTVNRGECVDYIFTKVLSAKVNVDNCHLAFFVVNATESLVLTNAIRTTSMTGTVPFEYSE